MIFARLNGATSAGSRVFPQILPQGTDYPAITYQTISTVRTHAMGQDSEVTRVRMQVNAWATSYAEARTLAQEIVTQLSRFKGTIGDTEVLDVLMDNELDTYEPDTMTRRVMLDMSLFTR